MARAKAKKSIVGGRVIAISIAVAIFGTLMILLYNLLT